MNTDAAATLPTVTSTVSVPEPRRVVRARREAPDGPARQVVRWLWRSRAVRAQLVLAAVLTAVVVGTLGIWLGTLIDHSEFASAAGEALLGDRAWTLALYLTPAVLALIFPATLAMQLPELRLRAPGSGRRVAARTVGGLATGLISGLAACAGAGFGGILALTIWGQPLVVFHGNAALLFLRLLAVSALFGAIGALLTQIFPGRRPRHLLIGAALVVGVVIEPVVRFLAIGNDTFAAVAQWLPGAIADSASGSPGLFRPEHVAAVAMHVPGIAAATGLAGVVIVLIGGALMAVRSRA